MGDMGTLAGLNVMSRTGDQVGEKAMLSGSLQPRGLYYGQNLYELSLAKR